MDKIVWKPEYNLGIEEIDTQHVKIIQMLNTLIESMKVGQGRLKAGDVLNDLIDYAEMHFKTEESYFVKFHYANAASHITEHENLRKRTLELVEHYKTGKVVISGEVLHFLMAWLEGHICGTDRMYVACFKENGL